jgi:hypothetical protein
MKLDSGIETDREKRKMDNYQAVSIAEGFCDFEPTEEQQISAWQHLIDTGLAWSLQGSFGRTAMALIEAGICTK